MQHQVSRNRLVSACDAILQPERFHDYCPNGLQVEGCDEVSHMVCGVTASLDLIEAAIAADAQALLVHHGWFWKGEPSVVTGMRRRRLARVLESGLNLLAYHLPLDVHPELGNNRQLAEKLEIAVRGQVAAGQVPGLLWYGEIPSPMSVAEFAALLQLRLARSPLVVGEPERQIRSIAWCTGGAQGYIEHAAQLGVDAYLSGEISEQTTHAARENELAYFAAGHHATERYGVQALGRALQQELGITCSFIDVDNPA